MHKARARSSPGLQVAGYGASCERFGRPLALLIFIPVFLSAQTTQGIISGQVRDSLTDVPLVGALVSCTNLDSGLEATATTDTSGIYTLPLLSPGEYSLKVSVALYQPQQLYQLNLAVGGRLAVRFRLRPLSDVWESGQSQAVIDPDSNHVVKFFGPDVDPNRFASVRSNQGESSNLDTSVSYVIDSRLIDDLPLLGRDVYSLLVVLPAVTSDTASGKGINVSVAGQRPSSSNFLLDGVESNNYLITGPLAPLNPEVFQEYRISTNNYSAEYGRTGSFIANAVTRSGTDAWHGSGRVFLKNDILDANGFQENTDGYPRAPLHQVEPGISLGGPVQKDRIFTFFSFDHLRYRSFGDPQYYLLPTQSFAASLNPSSPAGRLLQPFASYLPVGGSAPCAPMCAYVRQDPVSALNQTSIVDHTDFVTRGGKQRFMLRAALSTSVEPLIYSPYPGLSSDLDQKTSAFAIGWTASLSPAITNELKASRNGLRFTFDRPDPDAPSILAGGPLLPVSQSPSGFRDRDRTFELLDNISYARGAHFFRFGAGWLARQIETALSTNLQGTYTFQNLTDFAAATPSSLSLSYDLSDPSAVPDVNRQYSYNQAYLFAQDSYQVSRRLTLNYGIRYEFFGAPANTGDAKDSLIQLGSGDTFLQRLATAYFAPASTGRQQIYSAIEGNWAPRFAFAFDLWGNGKSVLRGSYGLFYDPSFDNLWQNVATNSLVVGSSSINQPVDFSLPARQIASSFPPYPALSVQDLVGPVLFQPRLRAARIQSAFLSFEQRFSKAVSFQLQGIGTLGRDLITTDLINRQDSEPANRSNLAGLINPNLLPLFYRANQGKSDYLGGSASLRFRSGIAEGQISYTFSHAIDNQSDPLAGTFQNYDFGTNFTSGGSPVIAAFTQQFNSQGDRADADFDQRQNLVFYSALEAPLFSGPVRRKFLSHWRLGTILALRSGLPYSAVAAGASSGSGPTYVNNRYDLITSPAAAYSDTAIPGGEQLLNPASFQLPASGMIGNTGRNEFRGPGLFNIDLSLGREFPVLKLGESGRLLVRADMFNALNHANLIYCADCGLGEAMYGRAETNSGFPLLLPLAETSRQIQLLVRLSF
jgi:Carboxypeptidase regulatory-like domain/TonB-dependent Receptor Plug Domain